MRTPPAYFVQGMHGMGDNLHQRAVVQRLLERSAVWLETPWPCLYADLVAEAKRSGGHRLQLLSKGSRLRTQRKNAQRERAAFDSRRPPFGSRSLQVSYSPDEVRAAGSVLEAMCAHAGVEPRSFALPVPDAWRALARAAVGPTDKPILFYRPLVNRTEWGGCLARNPDAEAYAQLVKSIRDRFTLVSVADLVPAVEWEVGEQIPADVVLHRGELTCEGLAGLVSMAALVVASPGFAVPLAQAVGTPVVCVFGGYENSASFRHAFSSTPYLGIDPVEPCQCFSHHHECRKAIDMPSALAALESFTHEIASHPEVLA